MVTLTLSAVLGLGENENVGFYFGPRGKYHKEEVLIFSQIGRLSLLTPKCVVAATVKFTLER